MSEFEATLDLKALPEIPHIRTLAVRDGVNFSSNPITFPADGQPILYFSVLFWIDFTGNGVRNVILGPMKPFEQGHRRSVTDLLSIKIDR